MWGERVFRNIKRGSITESMGALIRFDVLNVQNFFVFRGAHSLKKWPGRAQRAHVL